MENEECTCSPWSGDESEMCGYCLVNLIEDDEKLLIQAEVEENNYGDD